MGRAGEMPFMDATEVRRKENMPRNDSLARNPGGSPSKDNGNEKP